MIRVFEDSGFAKDIRLLPSAAQIKLVRCLEWLQENPFDPRLHSKPPKEPLAGLLSFRVTRDWRVIFKFIEPRLILLLRVRHRKDIYR